MDGTGVWRRLVMNRPISVELTEEEPNTTANAIATENKVGYKFKLVKDLSFDGTWYGDFKDSKIDPGCLKLTTVTMQKGGCFHCYEGVKNGKKVDRIKMYAYTEYKKGGMPLLDTSKTFLT